MLINILYVSTYNIAVINKSLDQSITHCFCYTYIHKLYLSSDFSVAYIASISDPKLLI